jgi:hypothetical protein
MDLEKTANFSFFRRKLVKMAKTVIVTLTPEGVINGQESVQQHLT